MAVSFTSPIMHGPLTPPDHKKKKEKEKEKCKMEAKQRHNSREREKYAWWGLYIFLGV